jgi:hypothetical protein
MGAMRNSYSILVGKPEGKRSLRIHSYRWEDNVIMDFREVGWEYVGWIHLAQDRDHDHVNMVMNFQIP